jgi:plastocyanin
MRRLAVTGAVCLAAATAGCGPNSGGGYGSAKNADAPDGTASTAAPSAAANATVQVAMQNIAFNPGQTTAKVGQTIKWTNMDGVPHTVTAVQGSTFKSTDLEPGQTYVYKAVRVGTIQYHCTIHPQMKATLQVVG